jgi:hypothetical protein
VLDENLEGVALRDREIMAASPVPIAELEYANELVEGFLETSCIADEERAVNAGILRIHCQTRHCPWF